MSIHQCSSIILFEFSVYWTFKLTWINIQAFELLNYWIFILDYRISKHSYYWIVTAVQARSIRREGVAGIEIEVLVGSPPLGLGFSWFMKLVLFSLVKNFWMSLDEPPTHLKNDATCLFNDHKYANTLKLNFITPCIQTAEIIGLLYLTSEWKQILLFPHIRCFTQHL